MSPSVAKTRKSVTLKVKLDIIHRHERGEKTNCIARHHLDSIYCRYYFQATSGNPRDPEGGNGTPSDVMSVLHGKDIEDSDENED
ncbi:hypothetical protein E2C01_024706 [Portunus trituberculatus]|uniref:HTH psq-type domain-containing protein n=1 Tax=Portunus trituberculatus TaxID=210409 RepID=A0A5B7EDL9_PORTR|nr:hypothetical protein [Portunus trituberculatus]